MANRVVPKGEALEAATRLAEHIASFPQQCLLTDRASANKSSLGTRRTLAQALREELNAGMQVLHKEGIDGARKFSQGAGRHGKL